MNDSIQMIPVDQIRISNPRHRDRKKFEVIVGSIKNLGLKKPIQVRRHSGGENGESSYELVCGQGRLEAFVALGYQQIPAIVVEISSEERLLRSLVENIARRQASPLELIQEIERLRSSGYTVEETAAKLDINSQTVTGLMALKQAGEQRLLEAVVNGKVPLWVAIDMAKAETPEMQRELLKAFESKKLTRVAIRLVRRLMDQRRFLGKDHLCGERPGRRGGTSTHQVLTVFKRESQRQKALVRKAKIAETRLLFIITAFNRLLADQHFRTLLRAESLTTMPQSLWSRLDHPEVEVV
jgi:ParB family transcriptional regulator, chromosome partitioning protein